MIQTIDYLMIDMSVLSFCIPFGGSFVTLTPFCNIDIGKSLLGIQLTII